MEKPIYKEFQAHKQYLHTQGDRAGSSEKSRCSEIERQHDWERDRWYKPQADRSDVLLCIHNTINCIVVKIVNRSVNLSHTNSTISA